MPSNLKMGLASLVISSLTLSCAYKKETPINELKATTTSNKLDSFIIAGKPLKEKEISTFKTVGITNSHENSICAGVIVDQKLILTAAHCVINRTADSDIEVRFGKNVYDSYVAYEVTEIHVEENYDHDAKWSSDSKKAIDLAVIVLKNEIPREYSPATILLDSSKLPALPNRVPMFIVGYGLDDITAMSGAGPLRSAYLDAFITHESKTIFSIYRTGRGPTQGDSGGPAFLLHTDKNNISNIYLAGILSRGDSENWMTSYYINTLAILKFLKPWMKLVLRQ